MSDLFGNPDPVATSPKASAAAVSLFDAAAERIAYEGGRNVAQVRAEITHPLVGSTLWGFDADGNYRVLSS
jgi:hypothetical protein